MIIEEKFYGKNRNTKVSGFSIVLPLAALLVCTGCPGTVGSSGSGNGEITPPSSDVGSFEDTGDGFIKISPPVAGITGMDTDPASLPGTEDYWKGVFRTGRKVKLSPYKLGKTEVPYKLWKEVHDWAIQPANGYKFAKVGVKGKDGSRSEEEPVTTVSWRDCIVWCNAYTQKIKGEGSTAKGRSYRRIKRRNEG